MGKARLWDVSGETAEPVRAKEASFSMVRVDVDNRRLTPTIQPFEGKVEVDPAELRAQAELRRRKEQSEEDDLRKTVVGGDDDDDDQLTEDELPEGETVAAARPKGQAGPSDYVAFLQRELVNSGLVTARHLESIKTKYKTKVREQQADAA